MNFMNWALILYVNHDPRRLVLIQRARLGYNAVISCCEKGLQWQRALDFLVQMRRQEVESSVITYNAVISACGRCQEWQWALQIFDDMKMSRMRRNVITYNAMLSSCERNWRLALQLLLAGAVEYVFLLFLFPNKGEDAKPTWKHLVAIIFFTRCSQHFPPWPFACF